ncbi:MAG TPA: translocation/assembly module TamB domain-containing protein, partial [Chthoniobacterales bacterium]|nr:translocation/assembly module TamB domain-containing protein [Chthoniobacterales bacterium]
MLITLGVLLGLFLIFHRPLLLGIGHKIALHYAARENLKVEFRLEGSIFTNLVVRNLHAVSTGPSDVESIDLDFARIDYGLFTLIRHGISSAIKNVDARNARIVLNPAKASLRPRPPNPKKKIDLPDVFPERLHLADATIVVRNQPRDFILEHAFVDLDPKRTGQIKIAKLQLVGGQTWLKLSAPATYANRNLLLRDLVLGDDERFRLINIDASQIAARKLGINVDYIAGEGTLSTRVVLHEAQTSLDTNVHVHAANVSLASINKFAALPENWIQGRLDTLDVDLTGLVSSPESWSGELTAEVSNFRQEQTTFDHGSFRILAKQARATLSMADIQQDKNELHLHGSTELPRDIRDLGRAPATFDLKATLPDLRQVTASLPQRISGAAEIAGKVNIHNSIVDGDLTINSPAIDFQNGHCENFTATAKISKKLQATNSDKPWFSDLTSSAAVAASNIRVRENVVDSLEGFVRQKNDAVTFERLVLKRKENEIALSGDYLLPRHFQNLDQQPAKIDLSINAPQLADYWKPDAADKISGPLQGTGQVEFRNGIANGQLSLFSTNLRMRDLVFTQLNSQCVIADNVIYLNDASVRLNDQEFVSAYATVDLGREHHYRGRFRANIPDLAKLQPLLRTFGNKNELAGSLAIEWEGEGETTKFRNAGTLRFALDNGRFGTARSLQATASATYSPEGLDIPTIFVRSDKMDFQAIAQAKGETLEITKIELDQGQAKYAGGYISVPFVWKNLGTDKPVLPSNGKVVAVFQSENLDIKKLFQDVGMKPAASGLLNVKLDAHGTLSDLDARLDVQMRDLRSLSLEKFEPASLDLTAQVRGKQLNVVGKLQQAKIQPLEMSADLPFDVPKIVEQRGFADDTPVKGKLRLPRSSVNFMRQFIPGVDELDGDAALDVDVKGTIARPVLSGSGDMSINVARMSDPTLPAVQNFKARMSFANDKVTLEQFGGELSGGHFVVSGGLSFPKLTEPTLDLQFKADSALIARNDTVTARADADIKIAGPLNTATVSGTVALTNSQFLKNLDLLPIGLPGRPAPKPPSSRPDFSIPQPPVRDWKFDVTIKTKDPFLIRGNLANGGAISDLHLTGTGLHPELQGWVRLQNVDATLPFSRLEISSGFLYFDPTDSFNPKIDMHGTSNIRDYTIHVYIYGTSLSPEAVFTSEPPLPQEEIISLLATGTTREELIGNNNVLAGRAAMLLVQQLY